MFGARQAPQERTQNSLGSGVIVRSTGVIVTNAHVVKGADELKIVLNDRREFEAKVVAQDEEIDVAVLQIDTKGERLPALQVSAKEDNLEIGDIVLAIGNPFGVGQTVTSGIVSALGRTNVTDVSSFIQTDAAVNPGNSGGALVNLSGELVGVNTAIFSRSGGSNGIGFAIPGELVKGPADLAGLVERDVILSIDGTDINDDSGLKFKLATLRKGQRANVKIWRDDRERILSVRADTPKESPPRDERIIDGFHSLDGATIVNLSPALADELGVDPYLSGVMITKTIRRSAAAANGVRPGDVIVNLNNTKITSTRQLAALLETVTDPENFDLSIDRGGRVYDVPARYWPRENN